MNRLDARVTWGLKTQLMRAVLVLVIEALEEHGDALLGLILNGNVRLQLKEDVHLVAGRRAVDRAVQDEQ